MHNEVAEGATVMLPVYHPGALLYIGDGHAIMADGEPIGSGVEDFDRRGILRGFEKEGEHPGTTP